MGPLVYVGTQCALLLVYWFVAWVAAMVWANPLRCADPGKRYLWWLSAPMFLLFLGFSLKTGGGEPNWPVTAYLSGLVLVTAWLDDRFGWIGVWSWRTQAILLSLACTFGVLLTVVVHKSELVRPLLTWWAPPTPTNPYALRNLDPTCRLRGWRFLAAEIDRLRREYRAQGIELVLAGTNWSLPGEMGVYCEGHPQAYSIGLALSDRHSQYDFWVGPVTQPDQFLGKSFLVLGGPDGRLNAAFAEVEPIQTVHYKEGGIDVSAWGITIAHGFNGRFPPRQDDQPNH